MLCAVLVHIGPWIKEWRLLKYSGTTALCDVTTASICRGLVSNVHCHFITSIIIHMICLNLSRPMVQLFESKSARRVATGHQCFNIHTVVVLSDTPFT